MRNQNNVGLNHGAGKGSAPRTVFNTNWRARYDEVVFPPKGSPDGFIRKGHKLIKRY